MSEHEKHGESAQTAKAPFFPEIDLLISSRLKEAEISFPESKMDDKDSSLSGFVSMCKKKITLRHTLTGIMFCAYCVKPLRKKFIDGVDEQFLKTAPDDFTYVLSMTAGFIGAVDVYNAHVKNTAEWPLGITFNLFQKDELMKIVHSAKYLLKEFPKQVDEAYEWILQHEGPNKEQMDAVKDFMKVLAKPGDMASKRNDAGFKAAAQQVLDVCGLGSKYSAAHNLLAIGTLEKIGIGTPFMELMFSIERILNYLDVLHFSYLSSTELSKNPEDLEYLM